MSYNEDNNNNENTDTLDHYEDGKDENDNVDSAYNRPRRPNPDTIEYLRALPLDVQASINEIDMFLQQGKEEEEQQQQQYENEKNDDEDDDDDTTLFPQSFAAAISAIDEIQNEVASLAGDEIGSQSLEILARIALPYSEYAARILLYSCSGYYLHLATHRYGSHFLQTIFQLSIEEKQQNNDTTTTTTTTDLARHTEAPQFTSSSSMGDLPKLSDLILNVVEELSPHASDLAIHICGSHVLRTLLCVLGGVKLISSAPGGGNNVNTDNNNQMRGRKKKKKKKKKKGQDATTTTSNIPHAGTMKVVYIDHSRISSSSSKEKKFRSALNALSSCLMGTDDDEIQNEQQQEHLLQLACHPSAGPLLIVLLRVLTYSSPSAKKEWKKQQKQQHQEATTTTTTTNAISDFRLGISPKEPTFEIDSEAHNFVRLLLGWSNGNSTSKNRKNDKDNKNDDDDNNTGSTNSSIYGLAGEQRGSNLLETILRLSPDDVYTSIVRDGNFCNHSTMQEYVEHTVGNFVVQTLLSTIRSKEEAETILKTVEKIISSGIAIDSKKNRRGILWRAIELSAKFRVNQESLLKAIKLGFLSLNNSNDTNQDDDDNNNNEDNDDEEDNTKKKKKKKKQRKKASAIDLKDCIPKLINFKKPEHDGERIALDVSGVRTIYHLLRFSPRLCEDIINGILMGLSSDELELIIKDGLGSRCIIDGILDNGIHKIPIFQLASKQLYEKLKDKWIILSNDRVGHHTVKKLFIALPRISDKALLVEELLLGGNRLNGTSMGRNVIEHCQVNEYRNDKKNWRKIISKQIVEQKSNSTTTTKRNDDTEWLRNKDNKKSKMIDKENKKYNNENENDNSNKKRKKSKKEKKKRKREKNEQTTEEEEEKVSKKKKTKKSSSSSRLFSVDMIMNAMSIPNHKVNK